MDNDKKAVGNQKVFVQLKDVMDLHQEYLNTVTAFNAARAAAVENNSNVALQSTVSIHRTRMQAYERIIRLLGLPISIPIGH